MMKSTLDASGAWLCKTWWVVAMAFRMFLSCC